ncbi:MAG: hypothetical protein N2039_02615 [Gemmataceae bacterium]|nr:hypothetical protein [Gemmataceae bacterium]
MKKLEWLVLSAILGWVGSARPTDFPDRLALVREFVNDRGNIEPLSFDRFRLRLGDLVGIGVAGPNSTELRQKVLRRRDELNARRARLTVDELLVLGECHYRLNDLEGAYSAWLEASVKDRRAYLPLSHLAMLKLIRGELAEARRYRLAARDNRPREIPGLTPAQAEWFFRIEAFLDRLISLRLAEQRASLATEQYKPDDLFGIAALTAGESFRPGPLDESELSSLPTDAVPAVQLLLLWMPHDSRLYWLLGELYNALGQPSWALTILNECVDPRRFHPETLRRHRQTLQEHFARIEEAEKEELARQDAVKRQSFFVAVALGGALVGVLLVWQVRLLLRRYRQRKSTGR